jgi:hypothetical protein
MKKAILMVAVIAATFTSCKKDRACTCTDTKVTTTTTSFPGTTPTTKTTTSTDAGVITYTKARKGDAKSACVSYKKSDSGNPSTYVSWTSEETMDCSLK